MGLQYIYILSSCASCAGVFSAGVGFLLGVSAMLLGLDSKSNQTSRKIIRNADGGPHYAGCGVRQADTGEIPCFSDHFKTLKSFNVDNVLVEIICGSPA